MQMVLRFALIAVFVVIGFVTRDDSDSGADGPPDEGYPAYEARFPLEDNRGRIRVGTDIYYFHDAVGEVLTVDAEGEELHVRFMIHDYFRPQFDSMPSGLRGYESKKEPGETWITVIPRTEDGEDMTPRQAAKAYGTGA
jgi:hypothetical protein